MYQTSRTTKRLLCSCVGALLAFAGAAHAQQVSPDFEFGISAGGTFFKQKQDALKMELMPSGMVQGSITENFANYVGMEQTFGYSQNDVRFHDPVNGILESITLSQRLFQFQNKLLVYTAPKTNRVRPYFSGGFGLMSFQPMDDAKSELRTSTNLPFGGSNIRNDTKFAATYGGGIKFYLSNHFGVRVGAEGILAANHIMVLLRPAFLLRSTFLREES